MAAFAPTELFGSLSRPGFDVRIYGTVFIWGSASLTVDLTFDKAILLHIRNDLHGSPVALGTRTASGTQTSLGSLQPGECVSIPVQTICGVFASCAADTDSVLSCMIHS